MSQECADHNRVSHVFVLDALQRDLIGKGSTNLAMFQRIFCQTEVVICRMIRTGPALGAIANKWSRDLAK